MLALAGLALAGCHRGPPKSAPLPPCSDEHPVYPCQAPQFGSDVDIKMERCPDASIDSSRDTVTVSGGTVALTSVVSQCPANHDEVDLEITVATNAGSAKKTVDLMVPWTVDAVDGKGASLYSRRILLSTFLCPEPECPGGRNTQPENLAVPLSHAAFPTAHVRVGLARRGE